jgi:hypothetical protein
MYLYVLCNGYVDTYELCRKLYIAVIIQALNSLTTAIKAVCWVWTRPTLRLCHSLVSSSPYSPNLIIHTDPMMPTPHGRLSLVALFDQRKPFNGP